MWSEKDANAVASSLKLYQKTINAARVDWHKFIPLLPSPLVEKLDSFRGTLTPSVAISCAIASKVCPICKKSFVGTSNGRYRAVCKSCQGHPDAPRLVRQRLDQTLIETYGSLTEAQAEINKTRVKTCKARYGVNFTFQAKEVKARIKKTIKTRYGVDNPSQSEVIAEKKRRTLQKNFGVDVPLHSDLIKEKTKATLLRQYGVTNVSQIPSVKKKKVKTSLERYGARHHLQNPEVLARALLASGVIYKVTSSRRTYLVQGYERFIIGFLENHFKKIRTQFDKSFVPLVLKDRRWVYQPDFYLPTVNQYVEVKSTWTLLRQKSYEESQRKARMAKDAGYSVRLLLVYDKHRLVVFPRDWFQLPLKTILKLLPTFPSKVLDQSYISIEKTDEKIKIPHKCNFSKKRFSSLP